MNLDAGGDPMALYISRWNPDGFDQRRQHDQSHRSPVAFRSLERPDRSMGSARSRQDGKSPVSIAKRHERAGLHGQCRARARRSQHDLHFDAVRSTRSIGRDVHDFVRDLQGRDGRTAAQAGIGRAITENSVIDNLRPIVPDPHGGDPTVIWFRGTYTTAHSIDATIVGIVDRSDEELGLVNYIDANTSNTTRSNGAAIGATGPSGNAGANDGLWHERTGFGNGGSVLASRESGTENAPMLKTTIDGAASRTVRTTSSPISGATMTRTGGSWAGLESNNLIDFRRYGSQHAEADQFLSIETVSANSNDLLLYRAYLGRTEVVGGADDQRLHRRLADVGRRRDPHLVRRRRLFVGHTIILLAGDFNDDGIVDAADYTVWRNNLGSDFDLGGNGDETGASHDIVDQGDYLLWKQHFGESNSRRWTSAPTWPCPSRPLGRSRCWSASRPVSGAIAEAEREDAASGIPRW